MRLALDVSRPVLFPLTWPPPPSTHQRPAISRRRECDRDTRSVGLGRVWRESIAGGRRLVERPRSRRSRSRTAILRDELPLVLPPASPPWKHPLPCSGRDQESAPLERHVIARRPRAALTRRDRATGPISGTDFASAANIAAAPKARRAARSPFRRGGGACAPKAISGSASCRGGT